MIYEDTPDGWFRPGMKDIRIACCDCSLVHVFSFRMNKGVFEMKVDRDNRATGQLRRHKKSNAK